MAKRRRKRSTSSSSNIFLNSSSDRLSGDWDILTTLDASPEEAESTDTPNELLHGRGGDGIGLAAFDVPCVVLVDGVLGRAGCTGGGGSASVLTGAEGSSSGSGTARGGNGATKRVAIVEHS